MTTSAPVKLEHASLRFGTREVWTDLSFTVTPGEFLAVIGPNGAGKTSLIKVLLGLQQLTTGRAWVHGHPPRAGNPVIGYVPQHRAFEPGLPIRGRDFVALGIDGHRWGIRWRTGQITRTVNAVLDRVRATSLADRPIGKLSGGEQQRLRVAQALAGNPSLLLCDEPLVSLDLHLQQVIVGLLVDWNRHRGATVIFVTHDITPILSVLHRILILARGRWAIGPPHAILTSETLSHLYGVPVDVFSHGGRVVIIGADMGGHEPFP